MNWEFLGCITRDQLEQLTESHNVSVRSTKNRVHKEPLRLYYCKNYRRFGCNYRIRCSFSTLTDRITVHRCGEHNHEKPNSMDGIDPQLLAHVKSCVGRGYKTFEIRETLEMSGVEPPPDAKLIRIVEKCWKHLAEGETAKEDDNFCLPVAPATECNEAVDGEQDTLEHRGGSDFAVLQEHLGFDSSSATAESNVETPSTSIQISSSDSIVEQKPQYAVSDGRQDTQTGITCIVEAEPAEHTETTHDQPLPTSRPLSTKKCRQTEPLAFLDRPPFASPLLPLSHATNSLQFNQQTVGQSKVTPSSDVVFDQPSRKQKRKKQKSDTEALSDQEFDLQPDESSIKRAKMKLIQMKIANEEEQHRAAMELRAKQAKAADEQIRTQQEALRSHQEKIRAHQEAIRTSQEQFDAARAQKDYFLKLKAGIN